MQELNAPLDGITVIDLTRVLAGPFCTQLLADQGARVIKVEPPGGDDTRKFGPFVHQKSAYFISNNRGKESICLDLKQPADRIILDQLLARGDVLVENFRPGTMEKLGYGWEILQKKYPHLIYASISGFGHSGPLMTAPAYDMVIQALSGLMSVTGSPDGGPQAIGISLCDIGAGMFAATGIVSALLWRERSGRARRVDVSMLDAALSMQGTNVMRYGATGEVPGRVGIRHSLITPFGAFACRDGQIILAAGNDHLFGQLCHVIGKTDLITDSRFTNNEARNENYAALKPLIEDALAARTVTEWLEILAKIGFPCAPINTMREAMLMPQVSARHMVVTATERGVSLPVAGNPIKLSDLPDPRPGQIAPDLDEHRGEILAWLRERS
ncbi:MAG: CaiB/BaiF CoA-transferase family protein [Candidatus Symbiobacter sp.]|nr:CaiB/BaiF CoA-transferase family protein [Candidatus Symbiobacter sp.]